MNRMLLVLAVSCLISSVGLSQSAENKTWLSLSAAHHEYDGDLGNEMLSFGIPNDMGVQLGVHRYVSPSFAVDLIVLYGSLDTDSSPFFKKSFVSNRLKLRYNFANGYVFQKDAAFQPFLTAGASVTPFFGEDEGISDELALGIPFGGGFDIRLSEGASLVIESLYHMNFTDDIDGARGVDGSGQDNFLTHTVGLKFRLGGNSDQDGDGVKDELDSCPAEAGSAATKGCPDDDGDRIINRNDLCPDQAGEAAFRGCPDSDNDKIPDFEDDCPEVPGLSAFRGCADTDNDSVADPFDDCPEVAGSEGTQGCPDDDGDGFKDSVDQCPSLAGIAEFGGCPDSDEDGIIDPEDGCPLLPGYRPNKGCPEINPAVRRALDVIFENLIFATNSANIDATSLDDLDVLVDIMKDDPNLKLSIEGHTDNRGDSQYNLELSRLRAEAVKQYLVDRGIAAGRITAIGYGQTRPVASNETVQGRLKNRRVELKVSYN